MIHIANYAVAQTRYKEKESTQRSGLPDASLQVPFVFPQAHNLSHSDLNDFLIGSALERAQN